MATVYLHRSDSEFWEMTPRVLVALIEQWRKIEINRDKMRAFIANGGNPDEEVMSQAQAEKIEAEMGDAMW
jgi:hypothetical protein